VAELLEARRRDSLNDLLKWGELLICDVPTPCLIARLGVNYGPALPMLIRPEAIPVLQKAPRDLKRFPPGLASA
jgi:hypothetical protein